MTSEDTLRLCLDCLSRIHQSGSIDIGAWPQTAPFAPPDIGLQSRDGQWLWPASPDRIDPLYLRERFPELEIQLFELIDSTNTKMLNVDGSIDQLVYLAEFQYGGRGRRGRQWLSPYARNLAMTVGLETNRSLSDLGGLSLVVGLAVVSAMEQLGVEGACLKWPNDVLINEQKICGILVELSEGNARRRVAIGVGINVQLNESERGRIDQQVTDLRSHGVILDRTRITEVVLKSLTQFLQHFESHGFGVFIDTFNTAHKFHLQPCRILQGQQEQRGIVQGVGKNGELLLEVDGAIVACHGGEVSIRADDTLS